MKLKGETVAFWIQMERWHGMKREERACKECDSGEVEDVCHWFCSVLHRTISGSFFWKPWRDQGRTFQSRMLEREQPLYCPWPVRTIVLSTISSMWSARFR